MGDPRAKRTDVLVSGRYRPMDAIGRGGMATVYRAHDEILDRDVALKLFRSSLPGGSERSDYEAEIRRLARLSHHGIVTLLDAGVDDSAPDELHPYLIMELVDGGNLEQVIRREQLTRRAIAEIGYDLAEALEYVHARGIVHRDIKPSNILIVEYGGDTFRARARLTDFGIALDPWSTSEVKEGVTTGTAAYLSPEQVLRDFIGPATDVYSLGLVLLECFTRSLTFPGEPVEAAVARVKLDPVIPAELGADWIRLIRAMTQRDPAARPQIREVLVRLRELVIAESAGSRPSSTVFADEPERMNAVHRYDVLDIPREASFDRITALAARLLDAPVALISVVDHDRIFFLSHHGLDFDEIDRNDSLCAIAMAEAEPWVIPDAVDDDRSASSSWVTGDFGMRFYASTRLLSADGYSIGALSVLDFRPREVTDDQIASLRDLAALVMNELELRLESRRPKSEILAKQELAGIARHSTVTLPSLDEAV